MRTNAFGAEIPTIAAIVSDSAVCEYLSQLLCRVLFQVWNTPDRRNDEGYRFLQPDALGLSGGDLIGKRLLEIAAESADDATYETAAHELLSQQLGFDGLEGALRRRAALIHDQIAHHLLPGSVLDYGCGDARVAHVLGYSHEVLAADVYRHAGVGALKFVPLREGEALEVRDDQFDNTLLLTVLHHSMDPQQVFADALRVTRPGGRIIIIASVIGGEKQHRYGEPMRRWDELYLQLSPEQQRLAGIFWDHLYNRVMHQGVQCPYNFQTPSAWKAMFEAAGAQELLCIQTGIDQLVVPEWHTLHVYEKA